MASTEIRCNLFIDGGEMEPQSGAYSVRENPATEKPLAEVAQGGPEDIDVAVRAAERAFPRWSPGVRARQVPSSDRPGTL